LGGKPPISSAFRRLEAEGAGFPGCCEAGGGTAQLAASLPTLRCRKTRAGHFGASVDSSRLLRWGSYEAVSGVVAINQ